MKANELMIGDYLFVEKDNLCIRKGSVVEIRGINADDRLDAKNLTGSAHCRPLDPFQFEGVIWLDYLEPIPLTPEILEENGFKSWKYGYILKEIVGMGGQATSATSPIEIIIYEGGHSVIMNPHEGKDFQGSIDYVHELQHALKLCGINKEIVL